MWQWVYSGVTTACYTLIALAALLWPHRFMHSLALDSLFVVLRRRLLHPGIQSHGMNTQHDAGRNTACIPGTCLSVYNCTVLCPCACSSEVIFSLSWKLLGCVLKTRSIHRLRSTCVQRSERTAQFCLLLRNVQSSRRHTLPLDVHSVVLAWTVITLCDL